MLGGVSASGVAVELAMPLGPWRTAARAMLAAIALMAMKLWIRHEAVALDQVDWCACASAAVTTRVILSRPWPIESPTSAVPSGVMTDADAATSHARFAEVQ